MDEYTDEALLHKALATTEEEIESLNRRLDNAKRVLADAEAEVFERAMVKERILLELLSMQMIFRTLSEKLNGAEKNEKLD